MRFAVSAFFLALSLLQAQVVPGRFIVELADGPTSSSKIPAAASARASVTRAVEGRGWQVVRSTSRLLNTLVVEGADASALQSLPGVRKVYPVVMVRKSLDRAIELHRVPEAWNLLNGAANQGEGIRIGILDTGIDVTHPGLQDESMKAPEGFPKLSAPAESTNTNGKVIVARQYLGRGSNTRDADGHGTGVGMIAAGRTHTGPRGSITGIAPKAWLGNYRVLDASGEGFNDAIVEALDDAVADGMHVVNMSLGSFPPLRPGDDILVRAVEKATAAGLIVVTAAGNQGPEPGTLDSPAVAPSAIAVGNSWNDRIYTTFVRLGGNLPLSALPRMGGGLPGSLRGGLRDAADVDPTGLACAALPDGSFQGQTALILRGECDFEVKLNRAMAAGAIAAIVYSHRDDPDAVRMSAGTATLPAMSLSNSDGLLLREQLRNDPGGELTLAFTAQVSPTDANRISNSSSRGPDPNAGVKPELLAVGSSVYTASNSQRGAATWQISSGTSFSSPMVAGAAALLKAARPGLTVSQYRSLLINSSREMSAVAGEPLPLQSAGAGRMDAASAMRATIAAVPATVTFGVGASSTVTRDRPVTLTNLAGAADTLTLSVVGYGAGPVPELSQNTLALDAGASREIALRFTAKDLAPGGYGGVLLVRSTLSDTEARIPWWFAVPSDKVSYLTLVPAQDSVDAGTSALYLVRPLDATGFPVEVRPEVTVVSGGGRVVGVQQHLLYAGFYVMSLRLGATPGPNVFDIVAGGLTRRLTVVGE